MSEVPSLPYREIIRAEGIRKLSLANLPVTTFLPSIEMLGYFNEVG